MLLYASVALPASHSCAELSPQQVASPVSHLLGFTINPQHLVKHLCCSVRFSIRNNSIRTQCQHAVRPAKCQATILAVAAATGNMKNLFQPPGAQDTSVRYNLACNSCSDKRCWRTVSTSMVSRLYPPHSFTYALIASSCTRSRIRVGPDNGNR